MPEIVNTTPLQGVSCINESSSDRETMIKVENVSMVFNMASEQLNSLKEYALALAKRELMFKEFRALDNISLEVKKGDVYGILGTNGSGKSTLLKIVAGVLEPTEGTCTINGNIAPLIELGAGFDLELTARENIYLNGALLGYSKSFIDQHFDEIVEFSEIEKFLDMPMKNYSSGMVARIAFAIATVIVPEILIVDEVLSVGDFMFQQKCERRIMELIKDHDVTVLIVSHSNDQVERLCNKAIWIEKGHTRIIGTAEEVCRTYRLLGGHIGSQESERCVYDLMCANLPVPADTYSTIAADDRYNNAVKLTELCDYPDQDTLILAYGNDVTACLIASSLANALGAPLLFTKDGSLPDATAHEIKKLSPKDIYLLFRGDVVNEDILKSIREASSNQADVKILNSQEAFELALLSHGTNNKWGRTALVTWDGCNGDIISLSPYLYATKTPIFFCQRDWSIDETTFSLLCSDSFEKVIILGGNDSFPDDYIEPIVNSGKEIVRLYANDPYEANGLINAWISEQTINGNGIIDDNEVIITSISYPFDAMAVSAYSGQRRCAVLLEDPQNLDSIAHAVRYIRGKNGTIKHLTFLGDGSRFSKLDKELLAKAAVEVTQ